MQIGLARVQKSISLLNVCVNLTLRNPGILLVERNVVEATAPFTFVYKASGLLLVFLLVWGCCFLFVFLLLFFTHFSAIHTPPSAYRLNILTPPFSLHHCSTLHLQKIKWKRCATILRWVHTRPAPHLSVYLTPYTQPNTSLFKRHSKSTRNHTEMTRVQMRSLRQRRLEQ